MKDISLFLAAFWGWFIVIFCVVLLVNPKRTSQLIKNLTHEKHLVLPAILTIVLGLVSVLLHNVWTLNWKLIITLFGWGTLLKGMHLFAFPKNTLKLIDTINHKWLPVLYIVLFLLGVILLNQVYQIVPY
jgi:hypothetical protein